MSVMSLYVSWNCLSWISDASMKENVNTCQIVAGAVKNHLEKGTIEQSEDPHAVTAFLVPKDDVLAYRAT